MEDIRVLGLEQSGVHDRLGRRKGIMGKPSDPCKAASMETTDVKPLIYIYPVQRGADNFQSHDYTETAVSNRMDRHYKASRLLRSCSINLFNTSFSFL
jgi:hypothetical protein